MYVIYNVSEAFSEYGPFVRAGRNTENPLAYVRDAKGVLPLAETVISYDDGEILLIENELQAKLFAASLSGPYMVMDKADALCQHSVMFATVAATMIHDMINFAIEECGGEESDAGVIDTSFPGALGLSNSVVITVNLPSERLVREFHFEIYNTEDTWEDKPNFAFEFIEIRTNAVLTSTIYFVPPTSVQAESPVVNTEPDEYDNDDDDFDGDDEVQGGVVEDAPVAVETPVEAPVDVLPLAMSPEQAAAFNNVVSALEAKIKELQDSVAATLSSFARK